MPICVSCKEEIRASNPLEMSDGFYHRSCWIGNTNKKLGVGN